MDLETIIHIEVSQKEKNKYHYQCIYVESRKKVQMNLFAGHEQRCIYREWTCGHRQGMRVWNEVRDS